MKKLLIIFLCIVGFYSCGNNIEPEISEIETKKEKLIIALGDSLTAGYNLDIKDSFPSQLESILNTNNYKYKITNAGVSGDTSNNLLERIGLYNELKADIYILSIGGNDGLRRLSLDDMKKNIETIINHLKDINPDSEIILTGMQIPLNLGLNYSAEFKNTFSEIADNNNLYFYEFLLDGVAKDVKLNLNDGIHPNPKGYQIIANKLFKFLENNKLITK